MKIWWTKKKTLVEYIECFLIVHWAVGQPYQEKRYFSYFKHIQPPMKCDDTNLFTIYGQFSAPNTPSPGSTGSKHKYEIVVCSKYIRKFIFTQRLLVLLVSTTFSFALNLNILFLFTDRTVYFVHLPFHPAVFGQCLVLFILNYSLTIINK